MNKKDVRSLASIKHDGTTEFANKVLKRRKKEKVARKSRRKNRGKK